MGNDPERAAEHLLTLSPNRQDSARNDNPSSPMQSPARNERKLKPKVKVQIPCCVWTMTRWSL